MSAETVSRCPGCGVVFSARDIEGMSRCPVCSLPFAARPSRPARPSAAGPLRGVHTAQAFVDPSTGHVVRFERAWLWALLFGPLYFAWRGAWFHAFMGIFAVVLTAGLAWLVYPFFAARLLRRHYLRQGFDPV
ncbi:hypothetical protein [Solidesulfovibrio sp.]|uniref:hypothetical protein n=1 Tax=Solidesulfovibrio sp. TaxID=2910990 RepID=UPI00261DB99C|nr:hypothetical protein [Solidesulfovibrio sp.]